VDVVKRWAFVPLLVPVCAIVGGSLASGGGHSETAGNIVGILVALPAALLIDRRRARRRSAP
jgi:hypothetical protein